MYFSISVAALLLLPHVLSCGDHHVRSVDRSPQFAPLPATTTGLPLGTGGFAVQDFGKGAYMVTEGVYQALFLVSNRGVIVVDCPPTIGHKILWAIGNLTSQPITHVVYSHVHADHIGAAWIFGNKVTTIAHIDTARYLEFTPDSNRPVPDITFHGSYSLRVGNQSLELSYKGEVHVQGNIFIYAPTQKVLMLVDVVFPGWIPFALLGQTKYLPGFIRAHDQILAYDFDHYIGGHLGRSGNRTDVLIQREYVRDLFTNCVWAVNQSATNDPNIGAAAIFGPVMTKNPGNPWAAFKVYLDTLAEVCADLTNKKWLGKLGGADVFQFENAGVVIESLRLDYGILGPSGTV